jgi:hypothetical protein
MEALCSRPKAGDAPMAIELQPEQGFFRVRPNGLTTRRWFSQNSRKALLDHVGTSRTSNL